MIIFFIALLPAKNFLFWVAKTVWSYSFIICIIGFKILLWVIFSFSYCSGFSLTRDNKIQTLLKLQSNKIHNLSIFLKILLFLPWLMNKLQLWEPTQKRRHTPSTLDDFQVIHFFHPLLIIVSHIKNVLFLILISVFKNSFIFRNKIFRNIILIKVLFLNWKCLKYKIY